MLSKRFGIGEVYRVYAQIMLVERLKETYHIENVREYPIDVISSEFPINWTQGLPNADTDCWLCWRATDETLRQITEEWEGYVLLIATNKYNPGYLLQRLYWKEQEAYYTKRGFEKKSKSLGIDVIESGYYDCPPWPDAPLGSTVETERHIPLPDEWVKKLLFFERIPFKTFRAHHPYVLGHI